MIAIPNIERPKLCKGGEKICFAWDDEKYRCRITEWKKPCPLIDIVTCGECKWWDKDGDRPFGYCHAEKHCHFSTNWEISIYRTYKSDHFCSDGERRSE